MTRMRGAHLLIGVVVAGVMLIAWVAAVVAHHREGLTTFGLTVVVACLLAGMALLWQWLRAAAEPADCFAAWRRYDCVRRLAVQPGSGDSVMLTLELACSGSPAMSAVVLEFEGVTDLELRQPWGHAFGWGGIRCEDRGPERRDGLRFLVRDDWNEEIAFACRSFAVAAADRSTG